jgi:hypothetical protein
MEQWWLIDYSTRVGWPEDDSPYDNFAETAIESEGQLRAELARLRRSPPALVSLVSPSQAALSIGLGPELSGLRWRERPPGEGSKVALNLRPLTKEDHMFEDCGGGTGFSPEHLLRTDEVIEAAVEFYRTGGRCPESVRWLTVV